MPNASFVPVRSTLLTQTAEHALRAALYLGGHEAGVLIPAGEIAEALGTPPNYTGKILRRLARRGLLRSARGPRGGFALRVDPRMLTVGQVLQAVEEPAEGGATCLLGDRSCNGSHPCDAHARWTELESRVATLLDDITMEDLLGARR